MQHWPARRVSRLDQRVLRDLARRAPGRSRLRGRPPNRRPYRRGTGAPLVTRRGLRGQGRGVAAGSQGRIRSQPIRGLRVALGAYRWRHQDREVAPHTGDPAEAAEALREHHKRQAAQRLRAGSAWQDNDLVFCTRNGTALAAGNVRRAFKAITKAARGASDRMTLWLPVWLPQMDKHSKNQWAVQDLNLWPLPCQGSALPLS